MDQDGGDGAAVHAAAVDAEQQAHGGDEVHTKGEGDQQGDAHGGRHAGDGTEQHAADSTQQGHEQDHGVKKDIRVAGKQ